MSFTLPSLKYKYSDMEPFIDKKTMEIHHTKHHAAYINNVNNNLIELEDLVDLSEDYLIKNLEIIPEEKRTVIRNNIGGHINHKLFWRCLKKHTILRDELKDAIENNFLSINKFKMKFEEYAMSVFGSGWTWVVKKDNRLDIVNTSNQDNPLMGEKISGACGYPIFGLDLWEHAYYLKYQNRRIDYVRAFWNIVNWDEAYIRFVNC